MSRVVYVTGAASGIGLATARRFAAAGDALAIADLNGAGLEEAARRLGEEYDVPVSTYAGDLGEDDTAAAFVQLASREVGAPDVLVNSAGIARMGSIPETSTETWDLVFRTNVRSVFLSCKAVLPAMMTAGRGTIVNVASEAGLVGFENYAAYSASKAAVVNLTRSMAIDHASSGVRVNAVCPGSIETPLLQQFFDAAESPTQARQIDAQVHPLGIGRPEDVAGAVYYLASDEAGYVTGHAMVVDGGYTAR